MGQEPPCPPRVLTSDSDVPPGCVIHILQDHLVPPAVPSPQGRVLPPCTPPGKPKEPASDFGGKHEAPHQEKTQGEGGTRATDCPWGGGPSLMLPACPSSRGRAGFLPHPRSSTHTTASPARVSLWLWVPDLPRMTQPRSRPRGGVGKHQTQHCSCSYRILCVSACLPCRPSSLSAAGTDPCY